MVKYILLIRHAKHESDAAGSASRKLSAEGRKESVEVAERLGELLGVDGRTSVPGLVVGVVWLAGTDEVKATWDVFESTLFQRKAGAPSAVEVPELCPLSFDPYRNTKTHLRLCDRLRADLSAPDSKGTVLVLAISPCWGGWLAS